MRSFANLNQPRQGTSFDHTRPTMAASWADQQVRSPAHAQLTTRFSHDSSRIPLSSGVLMPQAKLTVNAPGDVYEQEADQTADRVLRMPAPRLQRACDCGGGCPSCRVGQQDHEQAPLQIRRVEANGAANNVAPPIVHDVLRSSGQPLDSATAAFFESRFGHDFSQVRVHTGAQAAASAVSINARAYTAGREIVFGQGEYAPGTIEGRRLLAHELTHVVQQGASGAASAVQASIIQRGQARFTDCTENGHSLDDFRLILEDEGSEMEAPLRGTWIGGLDGFWWRYSNSHWYKITGDCKTEVTCFVRDEWPHIATATECPTTESILGSIFEERFDYGWKPRSIAPKQALPFPWND